MATLGDLIVRIGADPGNFSQVMSELGHHADEFAEQIKVAAEAMVAFGEALAITEALKELGEEALATFGAIQKAEISLTALTGDAEVAAKTIEGLKQIALSDALSFPALVQAQQRMTAFGFSAEQIPSILRATANAAAALDKDFAEISGSIDRIALSGNAGARQLTSLGLSLKDLGEVLGVADSKVKSVFKDLDESDRLKVITEALEKYKGVAEEAAKGITGLWTNLHTQVEFVMESLGKALAPVVSQVLGFASANLLPFVQSLVDGFNNLSTPVKEVAVAFALLLASIAPLAVALGTFGLAVMSISAALPAIEGMLGAMGLSFSGIGEAALAAAPALLAIGTIIAGIHLTGLDDELVTFADTFRNSFDGLADLVSPVTDAIKAIASTFGFADPLIQDATAALKLFTSAFSGLGSLKQTIIDGLFAPFSLLRDVLKDAGAALEYLSGKYKSMDTAAARFTAPPVPSADAYDKDSGPQGKSLAEIVAEKAAAAAATAELKSMEAEVRSFNNSVVDLFNSIPDTYKQYLATLENGGRTAKSMLASVEADINKAETLMLDMKGAPLAAMQEWVDGLKAAQSQLKDFAAQDVLGHLSKQFEAYSRKLADARFLAIGKAMFDAAWFENQKAALAELAKLQKAMDLEEDARRGAKAVKLVIDGFKDIIAQGKAIEDLGENASGKLAENMKRATEDIKAIEQLRKEGLATATDEQILLNRQMEIKLRMLTIDRDTRIEAVNLQIALKEVYGQDASKQIGQLEAIRLKMESARIAAHALGDVFLGIEHSFLNVFDNLDKGLTNLLVNGGKFSDLFKGIAKQFEADVVGAVVHGLTESLKKVFIDNVLTPIFKNLFGGLTDILTKTATQAPQIAATAANTTALVANTAALTALSAAIGASATATAAAATASTAASTASSTAGSAISAASSGISAAVSAVSGVVTAISSVIGNFQMAHMNTALGRIEENTRFAQIHLFHILEGQLNYLPQLVHMVDIWGAILTGNDHLADIAADVRGFGDVADRLRDMSHDLEQVLGGLSGTGGEAFSLAGMTDSLNASFTELEDTIVAQTDRLVEAITGIAPAVKESVAPVVKAVEQQTTETVQATQDLAPQLSQGQWPADLPNPLASSGSGSSNIEVVRAITSLGDLITTQFTRLIDALKGSAASTAEATQSTVDAVQNVTATLGPPVNQFATSTTQAVGAIPAAIESLATAITYLAPAFPNASGAMTGGDVLGSQQWLTAMIAQASLPPGSPSPAGSYTPYSSTTGHQTQQSISDFMYHPPGDTTVYVTAVDPTSRSITKGIVQGMEEVGITIR